ncbi:hypothetical protein SJI19_07640 [Acerihabitans sp. TG2]|uniref:hypothetical protein n=1 Tax=Acerihabitans sp. TG2 TaxID=3096008 RepID=UPI002B2333F9|nr:hypothetical protein [Acerihabitans sp. TG2]MEA9390415.1 hypothetical protein [Acerihabitans sp. TG2]
MERDSNWVELLIAHFAQDHNHAAAFRLVDSRERLRQHDCRNMNQTRFIFLDTLAEKYAAMPLSRDQGESAGASCILR